MSFNNGSYRAGKYGEDHVGKLNPSRSTKRGFSSTLRPGGVGGKRGVAVKHPNNNFNILSLAAKEETLKDHEIVIPPPAVLPDDLSDWEDDVSALSFSSELQKEKSSKSLVSSHHRSSRRKLEKVAEEGPAVVAQDALQHDQSQSMYPNLRPEKSRLAAIALQEYSQELNSGAYNDYNTEDESSLAELASVTGDLSLDGGTWKVFKKDQDTGSTILLEDDDSETIRTPESYYHRLEQLEAKKKKKKKRPSDEKKKKKKPSRKEKSDSSHQDVLTTSIRNNLPTNIDDETLAQLTSAVLEVVTIITTSSHDDKSSPGQSVSMQSAEERKERKSKRQKKKKAKTKKKEKHNVSFSTVEVREYERILSDNPSCTSGPSIGIGWRYDGQDTLMTTIDEFEDHRLETRFPSVPILSRFHREELLRELGYSRQDLAVAVREANRARNKRRQTVTNLYTQRAEEKAETAARFIKRRLSFGKKEEKL